MPTHSEWSRAHLKCAGGTEAQQQTAQNALDHRFTSDPDNPGRMLGYVKVELSRVESAWRVDLAELHPEGTRVLAIDEPPPPRPDPIDCRAAVEEALRGAGLEVHSARS